MGLRTRPFNPAVLTLFEASKFHLFDENASLTGLK